MNLQEIFNKVKTHLLSQNGRSTNESQRCAYRGKNNRKCAIGILIPDTLYNADLEGKSVYGREVCLVLNKTGITTDEGTKKFLNELQRVHDDEDLPISKWEDKLNHVATKYNLKYA